MPLPVLVCHPERSLARTLRQTQSKDPRISPLPVFVRHPERSSSRSLRTVQSKDLLLFVLRCHPERSRSRLYRERLSRRTPTNSNPPPPPTLSPTKSPPLLFLTPYH